MQDTDTTVWHSRNSRRQIVIQNQTALGCGRACTFLFFFTGYALFLQAFKLLHLLANIFERLLSEFPGQAASM